MKRDLLRIADLSTREIEDVLDLAQRLKADLKAGRPHPLLPGRTLAMIFEKPSLRTRVTFEVGMVQLGGAAIRPPRLLGGDDLIARGYAPGPLLGVILHALEEAQLEGRVRTREEAEQLVAERYPATSRR